MSYVRLMALMRKEVRHIYRDPQILFMAVVSQPGPLFLFLLA
jgi:hypothetical protein